MKHTNGFTMIELMVAILVLAIGLLGLAGLQVTGLRSNHNAYLRTQATILAQDMADRMRQSQQRNPALTQAQNQAQNLANLAAYLGSETTDDCSIKNCTSAQMAGYDLAKWHQALRDWLPDGAGVITNAGAVFTVSVTWNEYEEADTPANSVVLKRKFQMSFQP